MSRGIITSSTIGPAPRHRHLQAPLPVLRLEHLVPLVAEVHRDAGEDGEVVLHHQDPRLLLAHARASFAAGRWMVKVLPFPSSLLTVSLPPWASTMRRLMESPRPEPSVWRVRRLSTR